jgi:hypothetical protein
VQPYENANHASHAVLTANRPGALQNGALAFNLSGGDWLELDASSSSDPDGDQVFFHWWRYSEPGSYQGAVEIQGAERSVARLRVPAVTQPADLHLILTLIDSGKPPLTSYQRVIVHLQP